jgi:septal ring factor EnvC (AmiA/AmiB activator)
MQMDELTQQNAALVEQATAASQAMAEQVRGLNETLARYRAGDAANASASTYNTPSSSLVASGRVATAKPRAERRGAQRPWADRAAKAATTTGGSTDAGPTPARKATHTNGNGGNSDWREF